MNFNFNLSQSYSSQILYRQYFDGVEAAFECASSAWISADAFMNEINHFDYQACISYCLKSAEACAKLAAAFYKIAQNEVLNIRDELLECWEICRLCAEECRNFSHEFEHCLICSMCCDQVCKICERYLRD